MTKSDAKKEYIATEWHPFIPEVKIEVKTVSIQWREQAEKLAEALNELSQIDDDGMGGYVNDTANQALHQFEKWKEGAK